jgi:AraC-like DNA-binding protein
MDLTGRGTEPNEIPALGALQAVLAAAERLGVGRHALLAAAALESKDLETRGRALLVRLGSEEREGLREGASRDSEFVSRVRVELGAQMTDGRASVEEVARALALSPRTLQRRLERAGTTFGALIDDARRSAALEHLRNPRVAIKETAFLLGFSEPSTFYRAFRRWTGATPASYRRAFAS